MKQLWVRRLTRDDVTSGRVPLDIGRHEVLGGLHDGELVPFCVDELQHATHTAQTRQHDELSRRAPEQVVRLTLVQGFYKTNKGHLNVERGKGGKSYRNIFLSVHKTLPNTTSQYKVI